MKWNGCYSNTFDITSGPRQGSKHSPYLFNIFINQSLLDLNDCDVGVRIGDVSYTGAAPEVIAHLYKSISRPVLTYGMECNE